MTKQETAKIITVITAAYPNHFVKYTPEMIQNLIFAWYSVMEDYPYSVCSNGLKMYLANDTKGFPPSPGQVIDCITKQIHKDAPTALEAWQYVSKAIKNGIYHSEEEFDALPEIVKKAVGRHENLKEWAMMDSATVQSVEQSHFIRVYDTLVKRQQEDAKIPASVKKLMEQGGNLLEVDYTR